MARLQGAVIRWWPRGGVLPALAIGWCVALAPMGVSALAPDGAVPTAEAEAAGAPVAPGAPGPAADPAPRVPPPAGARAPTRVVPLAPPPADVPLANVPPAAAPPTATALPTATELLGQRDPLGRACALAASASHGGLRYYACGAAGLWVGRASAGGLRIVERRRLGGAVVGLFVQGGQLWARTRTEQAVPVGPADETTAASLNAQPATAAAVVPVSGPAPSAERARASDPVGQVGPVGQVVAFMEGGVVVDIDAGAAVQRGDRLAFLHAPPAGAEDFGADPEPLAVGVVVSASVGRARVALGTNEQVPIGTRAERTGARPTARVQFPPRASGYTEVVANVRPFLVLGTLGAGVFSDLALGYRGEHLHLQARMEPLSVAFADTTVASASGVLSAGYGGDYFELGLGLGGQTVNEPEFGLMAGSGLTISQQARLGALDGLHLQVSLNVVLFHSEFNFAGVRVQGQLPLTHRLAVVGRGGSDVAGTSFGELAARMRMLGRGGPGTFFLSLSIGGVAVFEQSGGVPFAPGGFAEDPTFFDVSYSGPMVGIGGEWRL